MAIVRNVRESEVKNRIRQEYFSEFDWTKALGDIIMKKYTVPILIGAALVACLFLWNLYNLFSEEPTEVTRLATIAVASIIVVSAGIAFVYVTVMVLVVLYKDLPFLCETTMTYGREGVAQLPANTADYIPFSWRHEFKDVRTGKNERKDVAAFGFSGQLIGDGTLVFRYRLEKDWHPVKDLDYKEIHFLAKCLRNAIEEETKQKV